MKEILTTYWPQAVLVLGGIGYLIKHWIDLSAKKTEVNHSKFLEYKMSGISAFIVSYTKLERLWNNIPIYRILDSKYTIDEVDGMLIPLLNEMQASTYSLMLYLDKADYSMCETIADNMKLIHQKLGQLYLYPPADMTLTAKVNDYSFYKSKIGKDNTALIRKVCDNIQNNYKS